MQNHPRPGQGNAGGEKQHNGNTLLYRRSAACVNAAAWESLTTQIVMEQARNGTLDPEIVAALLLAVGLEA